MPLDSGIQSLESGNTSDNWHEGGDYESSEESEELYEDEDETDGEEEEEGDIDEKVDGDVAGEEREVRVAKVGGEAEGGGDGEGDGHSGGKGKGKGKKTEGEGQGERRWKKGRVDGAADHGHNWRIAYTTLRGSAPGRSTLYVDTRHGKTTFAIRYWYADGERESDALC
jgi:hypothetical protein